MGRFSSINNSLKNNIYQLPTTTARELERLYEGTRREGSRAGSDIPMKGREGVGRGVSMYIHEATDEQMDMGAASSGGG